MKRIAIGQWACVLMSVWLLSMVGVCPVAAQQTDKEYKKAVAKLSKEYAKEGWKVQEGSKTLGEQVAEVYGLQLETDANGEPAWITAEGMSTAQNYNMARMKAQALARNALAGTIQTDLKSLMDQQIVNVQLPEGEAESYTQMILNSRSAVVQSLGQEVRSVLECYRVLPDGRTEVLVRMACQWKTIDEKLNIVRTR